MATNAARPRDKLLLDAYIQIHDGVKLIFETIEDDEKADASSFLIESLTKIIQKQLVVSPVAGAVSDMPTPDSQVFEHNHSASIASTELLDASHDTLISNPPAQYLPRPQTRRRVVTDHQLHGKFQAPDTKAASPFYLQKKSKNESRLGSHHDLLQPSSATAASKAQKEALLHNLFADRIPDASPIRRVKAAPLSSLYKSQNNQGN